MILQLCLRGKSGTVVVLALLAGMSAAGADESSGKLVGQLRDTDARVIPADSDLAKQLGQMLHEDVQARTQAAHMRENKAWQEVKTKADWEAFRDQRMAALRRSLGEFPAPPKDLKIRVTGKLEGDGYVLHQLVYESRPGLLVTASLYLPAQPAKSMPGILISHAHHTPRNHGELQDMGMTWARQGCLVLIPDHLGHGERRQHPFVDASSYPEQQYKIGRQDYYFRANVGHQLHLIGDSLLGWLAWDLMRGVDVLLAQPGIDKERIILLGAVAGGGDPAGVAAALDPRIAAVAPFNFGGPQPDYPIPPNAERDFYWFGWPSWETTRCQRGSARDGFAHWVIVGAVAPRRLMYSYEFGWEEQRDPAWPRLQKVFALYNRADYLATATGQGTIKGKPPENSHCAHIGALHRGKMYPTLQRWFAMTPPKEFEQRRDIKELTAASPDVLKEYQPRPVYELANDLAQRRLATARQRLEAIKPEARRQQLQKDWARILGDVEPKADPKVTPQGKQMLGQATVERLSLEVEPGIHVPMLLVLPPRPEKTRLPVVVAVAQEGKQAFLKQRADAIAELLQNGVAVCLPDVRGTGETRATGESRHFRGGSATLSQAELMLGQSLIGSRLRDVRSVLRYLRSRPELAADRVALWGDSFAPVNGPERNLRVPLDVDKFPAAAEPLGGLLALLAPLFEDQVRAVHIHNGLASYQTLLQSPFCYVPHEAVVPDALTVSDLGDVAAVLAPRPLRLEGLVDGLNRKMPANEVAVAYAPAQQAYRAARAEKRLELAAEKTPSVPASRWLIHQLKAE